MGDGERLAARIARADERCTGLRLTPDDVELLAAAARTCELHLELEEYDYLRAERDAA